MATVETSRWNGAQEEKFKELTRTILLPVIEKDILIGVPHSNATAIKDDGNFYIHIWSGPERRNQRRDIKPPREIYGYKVDCRDESFPPCGRPGESTVFMCERTKYAVAELFGDNLFIHHDLCHQGTSNELKIYEQLLNEVASSLKMSPEEMAARTEKELQKMKEKTGKARALFVELGCSGTLAAIRNAEDETRRNKSRCEEIKSGMDQCEAERSAARDQLKKFAEFEKSGTAYGDEFDKLLTVPGVFGVSIENKLLQVFTGMIRIVHDDATYVIGKFRIDISMYPREGEVGLKFFNLTNEGKGPGADPPRNFEADTRFNRHHPHVRDDGLPCLGNIAEAIPMYIRAGQYSVVVILAMQYLQTVNTEDGAGKGILWWPKDTTKTR